MRTKLSTAKMKILIDPQDESTDAPKTTETSEGKAARGEKTAENIRYGQAISEGGMGGKTTEDSHETQSQDYGRSSQSKETPGVSTEQNRASEGYGGKEDMDKNVGA